MVSEKALVIGVGLAIGAALAYWAASTKAGDIGRAVGGGVVDLVGGVFVGAYEAMPAPVKQEAKEVGAGQTWLNPFYVAGKIQDFF